MQVINEKRCPLIWGNARKSHIQGSRFHSVPSKFPFFLRSVNSLRLQKRIQRSSSVGIPRHFGADPDPGFRISDWPDPTPFYSDLKDAKKYLLRTYPQAHSLQSLVYCFKDKFCVKILFGKHYFSPLNTFMRKWKGSGTGAGSIHLNNRSGSGRPKNMRILLIRIPNTAFKIRKIAEFI